MVERIIEGLETAADAAAEANNSENNDSLVNGVVGGLVAGAVIGALKLTKVAYGKYKAKQAEKLVLLQQMATQQAAKVTEQNPNQNQTQQKK